MLGQSPATPTDLTGRTLGEFHVLRRLGEGGMGQVYLAEQTSLERKVALKLLKQELAADINALERFKAEALAVARVNHANIVQIYAINEEAGLHYMALEYVEGRNLREYLAKKGTLDASQTLSIMRQVAAALQRAAESSIIHRDIKPENILLTRKGEVKVADFGLSRSFAPEGKPLNLTQSGVTLGTPLYMSPEQVQGLPLDPRTDIYSFGVTCYHMLAGNPPFRKGTAFEVALQHVQNEPESLALIRPDVPAALCGMVHKMMAKKPDDRYQTSRDLLRDLNKLRENLSASPSLVAPTLLETGDASPTSLNMSGGKTRPDMLGAPSSVISAKPMRWMRWAVPASLVLAAAVGAAFGFRRGQQPANSGDTPVNEVDLSKLEAQYSPIKKEQSLKDTAKLYIDPGKDQDKIRVGLDLYRELALLYLDQGRWDEADQFFLELQNNPNQVEVYSAFGKLGHALILGLQSKPAESNKLFQEVLLMVVAARKAEYRDRSMAFQSFLGNTKFRQWMGEALEYNHKNDPVSFPRQLEPWRKGTVAAGPGRGKVDKSGAGK
ncbi:MAG: protein kinase domain-containing protein [Gemmataceae bacterium]